MSGKVYIVTESTWDHHMNLGVFSTEELAEEFIKERTPKLGPMSYCVEDYELDAIPEGWPLRKRSKK